jgi:hypothetical protein
LVKAPEDGSGRTWDRGCKNPGAEGAQTSVPSMVLSREEGCQKAEHPCHLLQFLNNTCTSGSVKAEFLLLYVIAGNKVCSNNFHTCCSQCKHFAFCFAQGKVRIPFFLGFLWKHSLSICMKIIATISLLALSSLHTGVWTQHLILARQALYH